MEEPKLEDLQYCAVFNFRKLSRALTQLYSQVMKETGLRSTQFTILGVLSHTEDITMSRLAEVLVMERTTLTRNLKPMSREGWIELKVGEDRRQRVVRLTDEGKALLLKALPLWAKAQERILGQWENEEDYMKVLGTVSKTIQQIQDN